MVNINFDPIKKEMIIYRREIKFISAVFLWLLTLQSVAGQHISAPGERIICYADERVNKSFVGPNKYLEINKNGRIQSNTKFEFDFNNVPGAAQDVITYAATIWAQVIRSDYPIKIIVNWKDLSSGVLGSARPASREANFTGAPIRNVWYPIALAERLARKELNEEDEYEISISLNQEKIWYFGLDGQTTENAHDLLSVALHEIGHGLGLSDTFTTSENIGSWGWEIRPNIYDYYIINSDSVQLINTEIIKNHSADLYKNLVSGDIQYASPSAYKTNGNIHPEIYAPSDFNSGSSISHLDETTYPAGDINSLMTPQISRAEAIHNTGPLVNAILADMGYVWAFLDHNEVPDQPRWDEDVVVSGKISSDSLLTEESSYLIYSFDNFNTILKAQLMFNADQTAFTTTMPAPGFKTFVDFYFSLTAVDQIVYRSPVNPNDENFTFGFGLVTDLKTTDLIKERLSIYPNPVINKEVNILIELDKPTGHIQIVLYNLHGKTIHSALITNTGLEIVHKVNLANMSKGLYIAEIIANNRVIKKTFILD